MKVIIIVESHLDYDWADWFDGLVITHLSNGTSQLHGTFPDQPALYGVLLKLRDLGIPLISVAKDPKSNNS